MCNKPHISYSRHRKLNFSWYNASTKSATRSLQFDFSSLKLRYYEGEKLSRVANHVRVEEYLTCSREMVSLITSPLTTNRCSLCGHAQRIHYRYQRIVFMNPERKLFFESCAFCYYKFLKRKNTWVTNLYLVSCSRWLTRFTSSVVGNFSGYTHHDEVCSFLLIRVFPEYEFFRVCSAT